MAAFAGVDDVQVLIQRPLVDSELDAAALYLDLITAEIEAEIGNFFTPGTHTVLMPGSWDQWIDLPIDATAVDSISLNGIPLPVSAWQWNRRRSIRRGTFFLEELNDDDSGSVTQGANGGGRLHWGGPSSTVEITFTVSDAAVPVSLKNLCLQIVLRAMTNPGGVLAESLGSYSVTYAPRLGAPAALLSADERATVRRRFARPPGTVTPFVR